MYNSPETGIPVSGKIGELLAFGVIMAMLMFAGWSLNMMGKHITTGVLDDSYTVYSLVTGLVLTGAALVVSEVAHIIKGHS